MADNKHKFKINAFLMAMPRSFILTDELAKIGIPYRTFFSDRNLLLTDKAEIPSDRLRKYARLFSCSIEELYNYDVQPIVKRVKTKAGLK